MRRTSCTMGGFCLLYLLMILLMRSGDVETNPGPDRIVSEEEFIKLSKLIAPSYYKEVGVHLKFSIAELGQIKERSLDTSDALIIVFTRWRDKQPPGTDIRALLAEELKRSDLGSLSGELLAGSLVPNRTGAPVTLPGSQTQPLSPDQIKRCADDFKFKYRTTLCKIRADPLNPDSIGPFKDMYTNLVLEEEYRQRKRPLEYEDLFDLEVNGEFPKRIVIQGEAGAGKTTFCAKIAWDWINDSPVVPKFVWVIVVPFREAKQYTIGEIAKLYLSKDNPATACQITEYIRSNPKDVFIAFDGLDEFDGKVVQQRKAGSKSECHQPKSADQTKARGSSSETGDIALRDILRSDELAACPVLVTSRPWKVKEIRWDDSLRKLYTFIYVEGFSKENVEVYIHKYFEDNLATADQLIQLTKVNDIISENMAPYPIYISMLCHMWRELCDEKREKFKSFQTFSQIFDEMFEFLKVHYVQKEITDLGSPSFQKYLSQIEKLLEPVAKIAFRGLQENTLIFKEGVFEQCSDSMEAACRVGVLSQEKKLSSIYDTSGPPLQSTIFFPHKLFQEYMAGVHLASLYELDHNEFNRLIEEVMLPRKEEFRYLLYFTVSRNKTIANHVMKCMLQAYGNGAWYFFDDIQLEEDRNFWVDLSFESQDLDTAALTNLEVNDSRLVPTISHDVVEIICSAPSLKRVTVNQAALHSDSLVVLAKEGNKSKPLHIT
ncbi:uncharacterized protein LOC115928105 [Strongylocentrotus purpuratus]|uniref:NACHT domain-containing protein n=1 Tax=Strongylocentrotus purpuratus TaxID=7668 RepID=A0A7M7T398_STRPU|nr:uncharacterized protein LOC115928105 [Strongylocentrotus purpuratus]